MSDLDNLKKYVNKDMKDSNIENDILTNSNKSSPAVKLCNTIFLGTLILFLIFLVLWFMASGHFWGDGLKMTKLSKLLGGSYDSKTVRFNLMLRALFFSFYMGFVTNLVSKVTCPVCGNFFTGRTRIWNKYRGYDIETKEYEETDSFDTKYFCSDETVTHHFDFMYQCKHCGNMYIENVNKSYTNTTKTNMTD